MLGFIKKYQVFIAVFLFLVSKQLLKDVLLINEADLLPVAKHVVNPAWIPGDWYLGTNLEGNYRYLFNLIFGSLAYILPLEYVSIIGRLFYLSVFAYFAQQIANYFKIPFWYFIPFLFFYTNNSSIGAREWMINGLESKSIAYAFVLLSILSWLKKNYMYFFLFCGLAVSFHVLVGAFAALTFVIAMLMNPLEFKADIGKFLKNSWIGILAGSFGIFAIGQFLFNEKLSLSPDPDLIYTLVRVPHHVIPSTWFIVPALIFGISGTLVAVIIYFRTKSKVLKMLSSIPIASTVFMAIGFIFYWMGKYTMLKFYWFRYPDAMIPFFLFIVFLPVILESLALYISKHRKWVDGVFIISSIILYFIFFATIFPSRVQAYMDDRPVAAVQLQDDIVETCQWIKENTEEDEVFLINPFFEHFYTLAERPAVVTVKHFPQSAEHVHEWFIRLGDVFGEALPVEAVSQNREILQEKFSNVSEENLKALQTKYNAKYYLAIKKREDLRSSLLYQNGSYYIYGLD